MEFISEQLVSSDYRDRLNADLQEATVCRFFVAYVSSEVIDAIGRSDLIRVLLEDRSFGVSSLTCSCGYQPLLTLQDEVGNQFSRLKYFMDPKVHHTDEPNDIVLFHSKLVYLFLPSQQKSVVYIGSHNWT